MAFMVFLLLELMVLCLISQHVDVRFFFLSFNNEPGLNTTRRSAAEASDMLRHGYKYEVEVLYKWGGSLYLSDTLLPQRASLILHKI
mmetsp:Transcript_15490/g.43925  ORF Transcript_15490/g.43925 Transcript_15490/m.43925 type:complete len:87 (-) Transcript_15490:7-267(-)